MGNRVQPHPWSTHPKGFRQMCQNPKATRNLFETRCVIWLPKNATMTYPVDLAERSKALESGSSPKGREFKSHSRHRNKLIFLVFICHQDVPWLSVVVT